MSGFYVSLIFIGILLVIFSLICVFLDKRKVFSFSKNFEEKKQELVEIINDAEQMIEELNRFSDYVVNQMDLKNEELSKNLKDAEEKVNALGERAKSAVIGVTAAVNDSTAIRVSAEVSDAVRGWSSSAVGGSSVIRSSSAVGSSSPVRSSSAVRSSSVVVEEHAQLSEPDEDIVETAVNSGVSDVTPHRMHGRADDPGIDQPRMQGRAVDMLNDQPMKNPIRKNEKVIPINNKYSEVIRLSQEGMAGFEIAKTLNIGKGEVELILGMRK